MFQIAYASCEDMSAPGVGWQRIAEHAPRIFISQGDTPYTAGGSNNMWGFGTVSGFSITTTVEEALAKYQQFWSKPGAAALLALRASGMLAYWQTDDHEWGGDNWDHTITQANAQSGIGASTQAHVNAHWKVGIDAMALALADDWDNPAFATGNTERPSAALSESQNPPVTDYPVRYFVRDFDASGALSAGPSHCRIIFLDCISYRSPTAATDNASKVMLGAQQEAWFQAQLEAAAAVPFVLVSSTKKLFRSAGIDNGDTFGEYTTERARLLAMIDATGTKPIWLSGDRHCAHVTETRKATGGVADIIDICACPIGVAVNYVGDVFENLIWKTEKRVYGLLTVQAGALTVQVREANTASVLWAATFAPGSNAPIYPAEVSAVRIA